MQSNAEFKERDAGSYDALAATFDGFTDRFSRYAVDAMLVRVPAHDRPAVLDIGCGTGVVTFEAARTLGDEARITGIDLSTGMLAFAREKAYRAGLDGRVRFVRGDAEALEIADASFDVVLSLYAWRHLPNPAKATAEAARVLRPGGTLVLAVGSGPALLSRSGVRAALAAPGRALARKWGRELAACDHLDGLIERIIPLAAHDEVPAWTKDQHEFSGSLESLVRGVGLTVRESTWVGREYEIASATEFWDLQSTFSSTARKRIADAPRAQVDRLEKQFMSECDTVQRRGGRLVYRVGASLVCAVKP